VDHYLFVRNTSDLQSHITLDGWAGVAIGLERGWNARQMAVVLRGIEEA
jgi:hypothetical protein